VLPGDSHLPPAGERAGLLIRDAKTGKYQFVDLGDPFLVRSKMNEATRHFPNTYTHYRSMFQRALKGCGLAAVGYKLHSLRRGGATRAFLLGVPFADMQVQGRWRSPTTTLSYLQGGRGLLLATQFPISVQRLLVVTEGRLGSLQAFCCCPGVEECGGFE
jgi:hypothetical protein